MPRNPTGQQPSGDGQGQLAAIVLAAGESTRMGSNKLLLPWRDTTVLGQTLANVGATTIRTTIVVTGHNPEPIAAQAADAGFQVIHNPDYANGMLSSVQAAVRNLSSETEAVLIILGDQPMIGAAIIQALVNAYHHTNHGLVAPYYHGRRGNPVLIDRRYFEELLILPAGSAPRALVERHPDDIMAVVVDDESVLYDLDKPEDYERFKP